MTQYASKTTVPASRSRQEIEQTLARYGATHFGFMTAPEGAQIAFRYADRNIRFSVRLPDETDRDIRLTPTGLQRSPAQRKEVLAQFERQRWRALLLVIKAKLEAVESGIATFEEEFYAYTVLPSGRTIFEETNEQVQNMILSGRQGPLMLEA